MDAGILDLILQGGSWLIGIFAAIAVGRQFIAFITHDKDLDRQDAKEDRERMYSLMEKQNELYSQQKEMLVKSEAYNKEALKGIKNSLDKLNEIQMLHTNRLYRIEDRQEKLESEVKKIGDKI